MVLQPGGLGAPLVALQANLPEPLAPSPEDTAHIPCQAESFCVLATEGLSPGLDGYTHVTLRLRGKGELR